MNGGGVFGDNTIVQTTNGAVRGYVTETHRYFKGIPYAEPPLGQLRWAPPLPAKSWQPNILNATEYSPGCPQRCILPPHMCPEKTDENCLYLNVYTPRTVKENEMLPVMFFLHGGRFEQGEGSSPLYNGEYIANQTNTILVSINYRLGVLGSLYTGSLPGNYALQDQRLALFWVRDNIKAFGGNPNMVTVFGQSAGGSSIAAHLTSPKSKGLFHRAIIQSNPFTLPMRSKSQALEIAQNFVKEVGCPWNKAETDACLRNKNSSEIVAAGHRAAEYIPWFHPLILFYPWTPIAGTDELPENPLQAIQKGNYERMPIIIGAVSEEALFFIYKASNGNKLTESQYIGILLYVFTDYSARVILQYPPDSFWSNSDFRPLLSKVGDGYIFLCTDRIALNAVSKFNSEHSAQYPVYQYDFNHAFSFDAWGQYTFCEGHVCHGSELPFVFHTAQPIYNFTKEEEKLSRSTVKYWTNFAHSGNPNDPSPTEPAWLPYSEKDKSYVELSIPIVPKKDLASDVCKFWDSVGYNHGIG